MLYSTTHMATVGVKGLNIIIIVSYLITFLLTYSMGMHKQRGNETKDMFI